MTKTIKNGKKLKAHIIQENIGGVSHDPVVFMEVARANKHYIELVNEVHATNFKGIKETLEYMKENNGNDDHEVLYWSIEVQ
jgi:hypothetical protein